MNRHWPPKHETPVVWLRVRNAGAELIPPFGVVVVNGVTDGVYDVGPPAYDGCTAILVNGPSPIGLGQLGQCHATWPCQVAYQPADDDDEPTPVNGQHWGAKADSHLLAKNAVGFIALDSGGDRYHATFLPASRPVADVIAITGPMTVDGFYPAVVRYPDPTTGLITDGEEIWYWELNG